MPRLVDAHVRSRSELGQHVAALLVGQLAQVQLVVVAQEGRPLRACRKAGQALHGLHQRLRVATRQGQPQLGVETEREQHLRPVVRPVRSRRTVAGEIVVRHVRLTQQHRVAGVPLHLLAPGVEDAEVQRPRIHPGCDLFQHERSRVDPEAGCAELQPEGHHPADLGPDGRIGPVQIRLEIIEAVEVPLAGLRMEGPGFLLLTGEYDALTPVGRLLLAPHVPIPIRRIRIAAGRAEPGMLVGGVVHHQVEQQPDAALPGLDGQLGEVPQGAQPRSMP